MSEENIQENETVNEESEKEAPAEEKKKDENRVVVFEEAVEAILFAAGHPISYATLARVFDMTPGKIKDKIFEYSLRYNDPSIPRGVVLLTYSDSCQLSTKQYYLNEIRDALGIKKSGSLSTSSMEALAIIAYNQPVTRIFVDTLRRADSSYAMNNLLDRGLIEPKGRLDAPGRPMLYGTTSDFLRVFGLKDINSLPRTTDEMKEIFAKTRNVETAVEDGTQETIEFPEDEEGKNDGGEYAMDSVEDAPEVYDEDETVYADGTEDEAVIEDGDEGKSQESDSDEEIIDGDDVSNESSVQTIEDAGAQENLGDSEADADARDTEGEDSNEENGDSEDAVGDKLPFDI